MRARSLPSRPSDGFILLHTLWLLLTASALVAGFLVVANRSSEEFALAEREARQELAQESAVEFAIHDIVTSGTRSRWLHAPLVTGAVVIEGQHITLTVQNVDGLVDLGTGDLKLIDALLTQVVRADRSAILAQLNTVRFAHDGVARPFANYSELHAALGASNRAFMCLSPYITLFSGRTIPDATLAPTELVTLLRLDHRTSEQASALETVSGVAGSTYRIEAVPALAGSLGGQILSIEITITGQIRPSHMIRSWRYRYRTAKDGSCS